MTALILFNPIWLVLFLPLSAIVTLHVDWKHRNVRPDRFFWRHWWAFPLLAVGSIFLGILIFFLVFYWNILQLLGNIPAMLIAFGIIHIGWIEIQRSRMKKII